MTRSRILVLSSALVVGVGMLLAVGAFLFLPSRAAVGPLPGEALVLPADTRYLLGLDVARFVKSAFFARSAQQASPQSLAELQSLTGLDPTKDIDRIVVAGQAGGDTMTLVLGHFDSAKLNAAMAGRSGVAASEHKGIPVYAFATQNPSSAAVALPTAAALLDAGTLALGSQASVEACIDRHAGGGGSLRDNATLMARLGRLKPGSTFWMAGDASLLASFSKLMTHGEGGITLPGLQGLTLTGDVDPQVSLDLVGETSDDAAAKNLADMARGLMAMATFQASQRPELKQLTSAISITTEGPSVRVSGRFPYELIDALRPGTAPAGKPPADK